jgi:predicted RNase H-like HicB family nuclease
MLLKFIQAAMRLAHYEMLNGEGIFGEIPGFDGVYAQAENLEDCREELASVLEEWIFVRISSGLPVPTVDGLELKVHTVA